MNPLIPLLGLGGIAALLFSSKADAAAIEASPTLPASGAPPGAASTTVSKNGHTWKLVPLSGGQTDVFAPAGSWGPHAELRVLRFKEGGPRTLTGKADGVPKAVFDAAMKDLGIKVASAAPTVMTPPGRPPMPMALQQEMIAVAMELGVDSNGVVRGPVKASGVQHATELASRLEQAGYPEAAAVVRKQATDAAKMVPVAPPAVTLPGVPPEIQAAIARALQLERDPAKLEALKQSLKTLPASAERDMLINALDALILQIRTAQAVSTAATEIDQATRPVSGPRLLKLAAPYMKGEDVRLWQNVLIGSGYKVAADGVFGPATSNATKDWQAKRGLKADGIVGPATLAKAGTTPLPAPSTPAPRPVSTPVTTAARNLSLTSPYMKGEDVRLWQSVLANAGYAVTPDGVFGPATSNATKDWQSKRGLKADGIVGPATRSAIGRPPTAPLSVPSTPSPRPDPLPKSSREIAAEAMVTHLLALQKKFGVVGSKGKQDMMIVKRFQSSVGGVADGLPGPNTLIEAARAGQGKLPKVMYWPRSATQDTLRDYRMKLGNIAATARSAGYSDLAAAILASAATEDGSGMIK